MGILTRALARFEKRDSLANPSRWLELAFGSGGQTATGIRVNESTALRQVTVFACVRILAEAISSLPLPVYRRLSDGGKMRVPEHPLYEILNVSANDRMGSMTLLETLVGHVALWGNSYCYVERDNGGRVRSLYPLLPDRTRPLIRNGQLMYETRLHTDPNGVAQSDGQMIYLSADEVMHVPGLSWDGLKGMSVVATLRENIGLGLALQEYSSRFFSNGALPGMMMIANKNLSPDQKTMLQTTWAENHQGLGNAQRMAILEGDFRIERLGMQNDDAQFLESRKFSRSEIASIFRVPAHLVGDLEKATFSNVEQQSLDFSVHTLRPWLRRFEQAITRRLFTDQERKIYFAEFLMDGLLRGDTATRYAAYHIGRQDGWMSANEVRAKEGLNPVLGGDSFLVPLNMTEATSPGPDASAQTNSSNVSQGRAKLMLTQRQSFAAVADRILRRERADVSRELERGRRTRSETIQWLETFYADHKSFCDREVTPMLQSYANVIRVDIERELHREIPDSEQLQKFVQSYAANFAHRHTAESLKELRQDSSPAIREKVFGGGSRRGQRIAEHEATRAGNAFAKAIYSHADVREVTWIARDACPDCTKLDGRAVATGEGFGADVGHVGHPPLHDGCTCILATEASPSHGNAVEEARDDNMKPEDMKAIIDSVVESLRATTPPPPQQPDIHVHIDKEAFVAKVDVSMPKSKGKKIVYDRQGRITGTENVE